KTGDDDFHHGVDPLWMIARKPETVRGTRMARTSRRPRRLKTAPGYMCCIIVSGFLSLTMSAIVRTTVTLPSFFHQCCKPLDSRPISPALCRIGTVHWLLYS